MLCVVQGFSFSIQYLLRGPFDLPLVDVVTISTVNVWKCMKQDNEAQSVMMCGDGRMPLFPVHKWDLQASLISMCLLPVEINHSAPWWIMWSVLAQKSL